MKRWCWPELIGFAYAGAVLVVLARGWPPFEIKSADAASWVQAVGSIVAIAAGFATLAIQRAQQRRRDDELDQQASRRFLVSIQAELSCAITRLKSEVSDIMVPEGRDSLERSSVRAIAPPFPIYENSGLELGRLLSDSHRTAIITAYSNFHGLFLSFAVHNELVDLLKAAEDADDKQDILHWEQELARHDRELLEEYAGVMNVAERVLAITPA